MRSRAWVRTGAAAPSLVLLPCLALGGPGETPASGVSCHTDVIVAFTQDEGPRPNAHFVTDLAHANAVQLTFLRTVGPGLYVFSLIATDHHANCSDALERLRRDARIRFVDLDARRRIGS